MEILMARKINLFPKCLRRPALLAAVLLVLGICSQSSRGQSPADKTGVDLTDNTAIEDGIRKGLLSYETAPVSEKSLERLDGTLNEKSVSVPLMVDRVHNELSVQAKINNKSVRFVLDTGGGSDFMLDDADAQGVKLTNQSSVKAEGIQGTETEKVGLVQRMTIGGLTLRQVVVTISHTTPCSVFGTMAFAKYRITLDFAAHTMTLTRGGTLKTPQGGASLSLPFDDDDGKIFIPVHVLNQDGWAVLDSGSDRTCIALTAAKAAAAQLPALNTKTIVSDLQSGIGNTAKAVIYLSLKVPVPISVNAEHDGAIFSTTSQIGSSDIDAVLDNQYGAGGSLKAILGFPFFLQFQRVILDYPTHTLVLQYPVKDTALKVADDVPSEDYLDYLQTKHVRAWPGYKWLQKGYGWIEVPDGKNPPPTANAPMRTTITDSPGAQVTTTVSGAMMVTFGQNSVTVTVNGVTKVYPVPPGLGVTVNPDGSVKFSPTANSTPLADSSPGSEMTTTSNGTVVVNNFVVVNKSFSVSKAMVVNGTLIVNGAFTAEEALTVNGTLVVNGAFAAKKAVTVNGAITIVSGGTTATITRGSAVETINGVTKVDPMPPDSGIIVDNDGSIHFSPPAPDSTNAAGQTGGT